MANAPKPDKHKGTTTKKKPATATKSAGRGARTKKATGKPPAKSKGAANRRSRDRPPARKRPKTKLTLMDRMHRARAIAAHRAKKRPTSWREIAKDVGLSESQCRDVYADFLRWETTRADPLAVVNDTIDAMTSAMHEASDIAAHADKGSAARTGAVKAFIEASTTRLALMQAAGQVPRYLGTFQAERELRTVLQEFAELLRRHDVGDSALAEFLDLAERVNARRQPAQPVLEGTAQAA